MRSGRLALVVLMVSVGLCACTHHGAAPPGNGEHYVITEAELTSAKELSLYDAVARLRPHFLRSRTITAHGRPATAPVNLYVDGERMDSLDDLRRVSIGDVKEVRFLEPQLANTRFAGYNNSGGAIAVVTKTGG